MRILSMVVAVLLSLALSVAWTAPAFAQTVRVIVNGSSVAFDQPPIVTGGRVLIPLRGVFEQLGAFVQWNPANHTIFATRAGTEVQLGIGSRIAFVNGSQVTLDVPATVVAGRTLVPLRFVSEVMGAHVQWESVSRTVYVTSSGAAQQPPAEVRITSVTHNAQGALRAGDTLTVRMRGTPGGDAFFTIEGVTGAVPMTERQSGVYVGRYTIPSPFLVQNARVLVTLNVDGRVATALAPTPLTVTGSANATLAIVSPASGASVGNPVVVRGVATPGSRVTVRVDYRGTVLLFPVSGTYGEATTTANASGNWQVSIQSSVRIPNAALIITAQAEDPLGREATPVTVQATQG